MDRSCCVENWVNWLTEWNITTGLVWSLSPCQGWLPGYHACVPLYCDNVIMNVCCMYQVLFIRARLSIGGPGLLSHCHIVIAHLIFKQLFKFDKTCNRISCTIKSSEWEQQSKLWGCCFLLVIYFSEIIFVQWGRPGGQLVDKQM